MLFCAIKGWVQKLHHLLNLFIMFHFYHRSGKLIGHEQVNSRQLKTLLNEKKLKLDNYNLA